MVKIKIVSIGKYKEDYLRKAAAEYGKRLSGYCALEEAVLEPERLPENPSALQIEKALAIEGEAILKRIPVGAFTIALCIEGKKLDSLAFAKLIKEQTLYKGQLCFVIGGSYGLSSQVKSSADFRLSISDMTFPHQLAKILLLEQIYRAFKINEGGTYHK